MYAAFIVVGCVTLNNMSPPDTDAFFSASLSAGSILAGFCGTFLSFRIQREATYFRQPSNDSESPEQGKAPHGSMTRGKSSPNSSASRGKDTYIGLTHFTASLFLLLMATAWTILFGVVVPLLELGRVGMNASPGIVVGGIIGGLLLLGSYFLAELVHYRIFQFLESDRGEWRREWWIVALGLLGALVSIAHFGFR